MKRVENPNATGKTAKPISYDPAATVPAQRDMDWKPVGMYEYGIQVGETKRNP